MCVIVRMCLWVTHTHTHMHTRTHTHAGTHTHTRARTHTQMNTRARTHTHTHPIHPIHNAPPTTHLEFLVKLAFAPVSDTVGTAKEEGEQEKGRRGYRISPFGVENRIPASRKGRREEVEGKRKEKKKRKKVSGHEMLKRGKNIFSRCWNE